MEKDEPYHHSRDRVTQLAMEAKGSEQGFERFCADEDVRAEVSKICRLAEKDYGHLDAYKHGDLPNEVWERMRHFVEHYTGEAKFKNATGKAKFTTYLNRVVRNMCIDAARREKKLPAPASAESVRENLLADETAPADIQRRVELRSAIERALSDEEQDIFLRRFHSDEMQTLADIVRAYGTSAPTIAKRLEEIKSKLLAALSQPAKVKRAGAGVDARIQARPRAESDKE